jgi:drug/metabolite transporter (DMT)-like permease
MTTTDVARPASPPRALVLAAFAAIYLVWGSTYLAIKYAIATVPPFFMTGARFLVAGAALYAWSSFANRGSSNRGSSDASMPSSALPTLPRQWRDAFVVGALLIVGGTALVGWAELSVPSGITSLILATTPLWMVVLESVLESRRVPAGRVMVGVGVGIAGLAILIAPSSGSSGGSVDSLGVGALALAALAWSVGAMYSRRSAARSLPPARATGMQMIAGAVLSIVGGFALGEHRQLALGSISLASWLAVGYLVIAGALIGFSAYLWLMRVSSPSRVATHAYVNPVVAVLLGWLVLGETVTMRTGVAMAVIVIAVVLIVSAPGRVRSPRTREVLSFRHGELAERRT